MVSALTGTISFSPLIYSGGVIEVVEVGGMCPRPHPVSVSDRLLVPTNCFVLFFSREEQFGVELGSAGNYSVYEGGYGGYGEII